MAKTELRVSFKDAPAQIMKQLFGEAKHAELITDGLTNFDGHAHEQELFHYLNTDADGDFVLVTGQDGKPTVNVSMINLRKQLATMVMTGLIKRLGERSARYALINYEGAAPEGEDEEDDAVEGAE